MDNLIESSRAPRPRLGDVVVEAFREDASPAQNRLAAEAPGLERQHDAPSRNRQVRQAARISTMDPVRNRATGRARALHAPRAYRNDGAIAIAQRINRGKPSGEQLCGAKRLHGADSLSKPGHTGASTSSNVSQSRYWTRKGVALGSDLTAMGHRALVDGRQDFARLGINVDDIADVAVVDFLVVVILHLHDLVARREGPSETSDLVFASGVQRRLHHYGHQPPENAV
jgi:hypothetical protein